MSRIAIGWLARLMNSCIVHEGWLPGSMSEPTDAGIVQVRDVDPATLAVLRDRARSLGQSLSGYLRDLMDSDAAAETNAEVIARIARDREPVDLTMDDILAARDEGRR
jgi:hypothetical protein